MIINGFNDLAATNYFQTVPSRIVSLVPSQTELLHDLGLEDSIVGITKFCVHPNHYAKTKRKVGGTKILDIEKVKNENPDIIIANKEENTKEIIEKLSEFCPVLVTDIKSVEDNTKMIEGLGKLFNKQDEAQQLINKINLAYLDFQFYVLDKPKQKVFYFIWAKPYMVAGNDTFINAMLELNNFKNNCNQERYPEIQLNQLMNTETDLILLSSEPYPFNQSHIGEIQQFTPNTKFVLVDGEYFSWYGSRILEAFGYFKKLQESL